MTGRPVAAEMPVSFSVNRAAAAEIRAHLARCDAHFVPPLSTRVDLATYAEKIAGHAERFEAWSTGELAGLIALYANDPRRCEAFVTSASVVPEWRGSGIGGRLMKNCIDHARRGGFERMSLRVDRGQAAAIRLYERCGFLQAPPEPGAAPRLGSDIIMTLELEEADGRHARL